LAAEIKKKTVWVITSGVWSIILPTLFNVKKLKIKTIKEKLLKRFLFQITPAPKDT